MVADTIVALSSGRPPAAIAVVRISGPQAIAVATTLAGTLPPARNAAVRALSDGTGALLDRALVIVFPGPASATGEDLVELHCHGGRAVVAAVEAAVLACAGTRAAEPGEFTRRALTNGRIDLTEAEGLADLLEAETDGQRRAALMASEGQVSRAIRGWLDRALGIAAGIEASIDFAEEGDVEREHDLLATANTQIDLLRRDMQAVLAVPPVERLRDGVRVVIAGPPNSGKSTLLNMMAARDAAIVSPHAGTTRDRVEVPVQRNGVAYLLTDTAGLNDAVDPVERIGVDRAREVMATADLLVWLGDDPPPRDALWVQSRADLPGRETLSKGRSVAIRSDRPASVERLWDVVVQRTGEMLPAAGSIVLGSRQRGLVEAAAEGLAANDNSLILAENVRHTIVVLSAILGIDATDAMLDTLFGRFCLGK